MNPYSSGDTVPGGAYVGFRVDGACFSLISGSAFTDQMRRAFDDVTKGAVKLISVDEGAVVINPGTVVVQSNMATDAATLRGMIVNSLNAMNGLNFPGISGCGGVSLVDGAIYRTDEAILSKPPVRPVTATSWPTALLVIGLGILAIAALIGVREFKASTGIA